MNRLTQCDLVYVHQGQDDEGNTVIETKSKTVKCAIMESFSVNYYNSQERDMRNSKNIVVALPYADDFSEDGKRYRLEYANFKGVKYKVTNILNNRRSAITSILDCQEVKGE